MLTLAACFWATDQKNGGDAPPAITYNDEVEDTVNDICKSKAYREYGLSDQTTEVCQSMIGVPCLPALSRCCSLFFPG